MVSGFWKGASESVPRAWATAELFVGTESNCAPVMVAEQRFVPGPARAPMATVKRPPALRLLTRQVTVLPPLVQAPRVLTKETNCTSGESWLTRSTLVASDGPRFVTPIVNVRLSPTETNAAEA